MQNEPETLPKPSIVPKIIYIAIIILFIVILFVMFRGNEDTWICQDGQWIKHGNPSSTMPTKACK